MGERKLTGNEKQWSNLNSKNVKSSGPTMRGSARTVGTTQGALEGPFLSVYKRTKMGGRHKRTIEVLNAKEKINGGTGHWIRGKFPKREKRKGERDEGGRKNRRKEWGGGRSGKGEQGRRRVRERIEREGGRGGRTNFSGSVRRRGSSGRRGREESRRGEKNERGVEARGGERRGV